jgi:hypothetical protein
VFALQWNPKSADIHRRQGKFAGKYIKNPQQVFPMF